MQKVQRLANGSYAGDVGTTKGSYNHMTTWVYNAYSLTNSLQVMTDLVLSGEYIAHSIVPVARCECLIRLVPTREGSIQGNN